MYAEITFPDGDPQDAIKLLKDNGYKHTGNSRGRVPAYDEFTHETSGQVAILRGNDD